MYKYLIVIISYLTSISIFVKSQTLSTLLPDSCFCSNYYENSDQCDSSVSQICYACGECYNDVNQLEEYSLMKPCNSDNIEIYTDSTCISYAGILKNTCSSLNVNTSFTLTSEDCSNLILFDKEINLNEFCPMGGVCNEGNEKDCNFNSNCSSICVGKGFPNAFCVEGANIGQLCVIDNDCIVECICNIFPPTTTIPIQNKECFIVSFFNASVNNCIGEPVNVTKAICKNSCINFIIASPFFEDLSIIPLCDGTAFLFDQADCNFFLNLISFPIPVCTSEFNLFDIKFELSNCGSATSIPTPTPSKTISPSETTIPIDENIITTIIIIATIVSICTILIVIVIIAIYFDNKKKIII